MFSAEKNFWYWMNEWSRYWESQYTLSDALWHICIHPPSTQRLERELPEHLRLIVDNTRR
jgi:hypothetical protein